MFHTPPSRWLYQRRPEEARYLLQEENKRLSDIYPEVGFKGLHLRFKPCLPCAGGVFRF
ncbi:hypothetical protein [Hymenobacter convexus]|uniref:hypothetical protein n=1 Tax=Hymenobacter sp. CA1UV-4 TaxID=3063782 RepID=UPI0035102927